MERSDLHSIKEKLKLRAHKKRITLRLKLEKIGVILDTPNRS